MQNILQIEALIREVEGSADPGLRAQVRRLVEAILEYHGSALDRLLELSGEETVRTVARDELVSSLLLLYGFHPDDFETRVRRAVDGIPNVELVAIADGAVRLRALGQVTQEAAEQIIYAAAPETTLVEIMDLVPQAPPAFVPLEALLRA